jgi:hypothetical protein
MNVKRFMAYSLRPLLLTLLLLFHVSTCTLAVGDMEDLIPPNSCGAGWKIDGKPLFYDRDTLSDRIDGEAELYFPYGFDRMAAARYASEKSPGTGMDVEIFRMGSLLDAFGIYANYRQKDGRALAVGAESNLSASQLFLYQGRHFVHIQVTGTDDTNLDALAECVQTVVSRMPGNKNRPTELSAFDRLDVVKGTERYLPQSLLGYDFLNKGIIADAVVEGKNLQIFLLLGTTVESASAAFNRYRSQLAQGKIEPGGGSAAFLEGVDPLYGPVIIIKKGDCLAGALKFCAEKGVRALLENVCR